MGAAKNRRTIAVHACDSTPDGIQDLLSQAVWDAAAIRDAAAKYLEHIDAMLVVNETRDVNKSCCSVGVHRHGRADREQSSRGCF
jgi:hypothetical protein